MQQLIQTAYAFLDQLHVSVTGLVIAMMVFALAFLFALREAASWFFKVDDLKRDIARLHEISLQLEGEVKLVQNLVAQASQNLQATSQPASTPPATELIPEASQRTAPAAEPAPLFAINNETKTAAASEPAQKTEAAPKGGFPIVH